MAVPSDVSDFKYNGDGVTTVFMVPFTVFSGGDLVIALHDTVAGVDVVPAPVLNGAGTYDFTFAGTFDPSIGEYTANNQITFNNPLPATYFVAGERSVDAIQQSIFLDNSKFPAKRVEGSLDRITMVAQQLLGKMKRALIQQLTTSIDNLQIPTPAAGLFWRWNAAADGLENASVTSVAGVVVSASEVDEGIARVATMAKIDGAADDLAFATSLKTGRLLKQGTGVAIAANAIAKPADVDRGGRYHITTGAGWTLNTLWNNATFPWPQTFVADNAGTLTSSANLILPTGANIAVSAGDVFTFVPEGGTIWRLTFYQRKDGTALAGSGNGYATYAANHNPNGSEAGKVIEFTGAGGYICQIPAGQSNVVKNSSAGDVTVSMSAGNLDGQATRKVRPGDRVTVQGTGAAGVTIGGEYSYDSGQQTITLGAALNLAHGLGVKPERVKVQIECTSIDGNYAVGDVIDIGPTMYNGFELDHFSLKQNATNLKLNVGSGRIQIIDDSTLAPVSIDVTKWKWRVRAWTR
jgi:hypothetical protein